MSITFDEAFDRLIGHEGGFTKNPNDPGNWTGGKTGIGKLVGTKYGIAANTYPLLDIPNLTLEQAKAIYKKDWWDRVQGIDPAIIYQVWDFAINAGMGRAVRELQAAVGVKADGFFGAESRKAVNARPVADVILLLSAARLNFYTGLSGWDRYGKGWTRRVASNLQYAAGDC